jgi:hypothetical protein
MKPLASVLNTIHTIDQNHITCHMGTFCWLYASIHDQLPTLNQYLAVVPVGPQTKMTEMVRLYGTRLTQPFSGTLRLTPGSVLVFVDKANGEARHSCVAFTNNQICGYNQGGWYSKPGVVNRKTIHDVSELQWKSGVDRSLLRTDNYTCKLYTVPEVSAKHYFQTLP